jgi:hypothetical protein
MKFAWIEETVIESQEVFDGEGSPFDPPQYEDVAVGTGNGPVTGLNRGAEAGERQGAITPQHLVWGMDNEAYRVVNGEFVAMDETQKAALDAQREDERLAESQRLTDLEARVAELESEQESVGLHKYTPQQVKDYIDNQFAAASTNAETVAVVKKLFKKLAVYTLRAEYRG